MEDSRTNQEFVAFAAAPGTKQMISYTYRFIAAGMALLGAFQGLAVLFGAVVGSDTVILVGGSVVFFGFLVCGFPAYAAFQRRINREGPIHIRVSGDSLSLDDKPRTTFPLSTARIGRWIPEGCSGLTKGTALHLRCERRTFVLGGRDHRSAPDETPPVARVDAWMWAAEFDELLAVADRACRGEARGPESGQPTRCLLVPNPMRSVSSSPFGLFKNTVTALKLSANPPQPSAAIDLSEGAISVVDLGSDLKRDTVTASAPVAQVTVTAAQCTRSIPRAGTQNTPVLNVQIANSPPLRIGCPDLARPPQATWGGGAKLTSRFSWRGGVPQEKEPGFVVSEPDWLQLVETFGLIADLQDNARVNAASTAATAAVPSRAPAPRPQTKRLTLAVVTVFAIVPIIWVPALIVLNRHHRHDDQQTANRERPFALPFTDLHLPHGVAIDGAGNFYVTDVRTNEVLELRAGSSTQTVLPFTGLDLSGGGADESTGGVAVDARGNVYVSDTGHDRVLKLAAGSSTQTVLPFQGLDGPQGVAVGVTGTVYVADEGNARVVELAAGSATPTMLPFGNYVYPHDLAIDGSGTVYAGIHTGKRRYVLRLTPGSGTWSKLPSGGDQRHMTVDNTGNLYIVTSGDHGALMRLAPGSKEWVALPGQPHFVNPQGLAVDSHGYAYVTDYTGKGQPAVLFGWTLVNDDSHGFVLKLPVG